MIHGDRGGGHHVFIVHILHHAHDPPGASAEADKLNYRIGPADVPVQRVLTGKHALRQALAYDHHRLAALAVGVIEIAARQNRNAERREETRRHAPEPCERIFFAIPVNLAVGRKLEPETEDSLVTPGNRGSQRDAIHAGQFADPANGFLMEADHLFARFAIRHVRHIDGQHVARRIRSGWLAESSSVFSSMLAPASSTNDAAIWITANIRSRRLALPVTRALPGQTEALR